MALNDIRIKVDRAKEHLGAFTSELDRFASEKPYPLHVVAPYGNEVFDVVWVRRVPPRWAAMIGDCVHNLRTALDHIVWQLSGGDTLDPVEGRFIEFPIFRDEKKYLKRTHDGQAASGSGLKKIERIPAFGAWTVIRRLQPFRAGEPERHPLWIIHELDRVDKHRALHVVTGWAYAEPWKLGIHDSATMLPGFRQVRATQSPTYPTQTPPGYKTRVKVRSDLAMRVTLEAEAVREDENIDVVLARLIDFVEVDVLGAFAPYLDHPQVSSDA